MSFGRNTLSGIGALLSVCILPARVEAARYVVEIRNMSFGAAPQHLKVGDIIQWRNLDMFRHTATARTGNFDFDLPPGAQAEAALKKAGTVNVFCRYHPTMTLRLTVEKDH